MADPHAAHPAVKPTFADDLNGYLSALWDHLSRLDAREAGLNVLLSAGVVLLAFALIWTLGQAFDRLFARMERDLTPGEQPVQPKPTRRVAGLSWSLLRVVILLAALLWVASVWGIDPWGWLTGENGARLVRLTLIVVLVTALVEAAGFVIRRVIEGVATQSRDPRRAAQLRTLGPLLTGSVQSVLIVVGLLTFLSEVGVQVGPLLASAGVVGIAVGFGAQTLVKDFLTGIFLIAEDVVSVGDVVRIADAQGAVEAMTLRTIRLRSQNGTLHIFPYSEAQVIHNHTKDFSAYVFEVVVAYSTDIDRALAVLQEVGDGLKADRKFSAKITKACEVLGVEKLGEAGVSLRARITTTPKSHLIVGREYNRRVKLAFDAAGIQTPYTTIQMMPADAAPAPPQPAPSRRRTTKG